MKPCGDAPCTGCKGGGQRARRVRARGAPAVMFALMGGREPVVPRRRMLRAAQPSVDVGEPCTMPVLYCLSRRSEAMALPRTPRPACRLSSEYSANVPPARARRCALGAAPASAAACTRRARHCHGSEPGRVRM